MLTTAEVRSRCRTDAEASFERLQSAGASGDTDEIRRSMAGVLGDLYRWRVFECRAMSATTGTVVKHLGGVSPEGELLEGLILWRDVAEHHPEQLVELRHYPLAPSEDLAPSNHLYPGHNLSIVRAEDEPQRISEERRPRREVFRARVAGQPLLPILERCINFLDGLAQ